MSFKITKNYSTVHAWIRRKYGKANICEESTCNGKSKRFTYAKIKGKRYSRKRENYKMLCYSCHVQYDMGKDTIKRMKKNSFNAKKTYCLAGHKYEGKNIYWYGKSKEYRGCKLCRRIDLKRFRKAHASEIALYRKQNREIINANWRNYYNKNKFDKTKTYAKKKLGGEV